MLIGCSRAAKEFASGYANERVAFGRPISSFQGVAFLIADRDMAIEAAAHGTVRCGRRDRRMEDRGSRSRRSTRGALDRCAQVALETTREGVQILGGHGFIREYPVERWYRRRGRAVCPRLRPLAGQASFLRRPDDPSVRSDTPMPNASRSPTMQLHSPKIESASRSRVGPRARSSPGTRGRRRRTAPPQG